MANALAGLEPQRTFIVHGSDGLDEVTTTGPTTVFEVAGQKVNRFTWSPADFGVSPAKASDLAGGDRSQNRQIAMSILKGEPGARRDIVLVNAAAALLAAGVASNPQAGMQQAAASIDSGSAWSKLERLIDFARK
jgi:anthranilate phosphoribosyltransferase